MSDRVEDREPRLIGSSAPMRALQQAIGAVAPSRATVLVTGETGTGKGLVARCLHAQRGRGPFVHVDCASLSPTVIESELFGHERGAFTGAIARRRGRFELAGEGTVFLDEVAEVDVGLQAKLLRVLQDLRFERVGGTRALPLGARVVAATNRDLQLELPLGRFRQDLYYRLQVVELQVPPLRERAGDIRELFAWAVARTSLARPPRVTDDFVRRLECHSWPGNVRELMNVAERLVVTRAPEPWRAANLDGLLGSRAAAAPCAPGELPSRAGFDARERADLARVLERHRWNVSAAARSLGLSRGALRGRMCRLGLA